MITRFNENSPGGQCEPNSPIQGTGEGTKEGRRETN